jgi:hypothetical protein
VSTDAPAFVQQPARLTPQGAAPIASTREELRALVREWTFLMRRDRMRPENARLAVKSFVAEVAGPHVTRYQPADMADYGRSELLGDAGQWCIDAYFDLSPHARGFKAR